MKKFTTLRLTMRLYLAIAQLFFLLYVIITLVGYYFRFGTPLIYAISLVPIQRLSNDFKEDLIRADIPIGRILKKHNIESRREIKTVNVEDISEELKEIFQTDSPMLSRTYNIIHQDEILISLKEMFPYSLFQE